MSAGWAWLAVALPLAGAAAQLALRDPWRWRVGLGVAGATLAVAAAVAVLGAEGVLRADALGGRLAVVVALAGALAAWCGTARALWVVVALQFAVLAADPALAAAGLAGAVLAMLAGAAPWRALIGALPALGLLLAGAVMMRLPEGGGIGLALLLPGLAACAGLVPLNGWQRRAMVLAPAVAAATLGAALRLRDVELVPPVLLGLGIATLAWAAWRGGAGTLHAGLAAVAVGVGADAAAMLLVSAAAVLVPVQDGWARAGATLALALLPPFAPFGAALSVLAASGPWLGVAVAALTAAGAARLIRGLAWPAWAGLRAEAPGLLALLLVLLTGCVPAAARWMAP